MYREKELKIREALQQLLMTMAIELVNVPFAGSVNIYLSS